MLIYVVFIMHTNTPKVLINIKSIPKQTVCLLQPSVSVLGVLAVIVEKYSSF